MPGSSSRLSASIFAMAERHPLLTLISEGCDSTDVAVWEGWVQPTRSLKDFDLIVSDLHYNRPIVLSDDGEILHYPKCKGPHDKPSLRKYIDRPNRSFKVRIEYSGGAQHPRAFMIDPVLIRRPGDHTFGDGASCPYPPWEHVWDWQRNTVADFTDHLLVWLVKWNVFNATDGKVWLGPEKEHDPVFLAATVKPDDQCWCGSSLRYAHCHQSSDMQTAQDELRSGFQRQGPLHQMPTAKISALKTLSRFLAFRKN